VGELKQFSFSDLATMDGGRIGIAVDQAVKRAAEDCWDLPGEKAARKITIQIEIKPELDQDGMCDSVSTVVQIKQSLPTRKTRPYDFGLRKNGVLTYQPDALDNHEQDTFEFEEG
jgi:hypothetical protein